MSNSHYWHPVQFRIYPIFHYAVFNHGAVYILVRRNPDGSRDPLYIGQAGDPSRRLGPSHERWQEALDLGFNELHLCFCGPDEGARCRIENRLLMHHWTPLNERVPTGTLADAAPSRNALRDIYYGMTGTRLRDVYAPAPRLNGLLGSLSDVPTRPTKGLGKRGLF